MSDSDIHVSMLTSEELEMIKAHRRASRRSSSERFVIGKLMNFYHKLDPRWEKSKAWLHEYVHGLEDGPLQKLVSILDKVD